jgi:alpha-galactosidase
LDIRICENNIYLDIEITDEGDVKLLNLSPHPFSPSQERDYQKYRLVEVHESGMNQNDHHGSKHTGSCPGYLLRYKDHRDYRNGYGRKLEIVQSYGGLELISHMQFYDGISVVRTWTEIHNESDDIHPIEYVSSFTLTGLPHGELPRDVGSRIHIPHSTWYGEAQWKSYTLHDLGYDCVNTFSVKRISLSNTGTWAASEHLPMGSYENLETGTTLIWQIETSASWHWEISDIAGELYLQISGPTYQENAFLKKLGPGQCFESVPCAVSIVAGDFQNSIRELTRYRRIIRRKNRDNESPSVIFNDYMNCLWGDPTTEKLIPLIDAAAKAQCDYFCIDAGWYADGYWWDGVGQWLPSDARFPGGIKEPLDYIRSKGMIPGLWLELEVIGIKCPLVDKVSIDWFFQRNGRRIIDEGRYQLDFRNQEVIAHANSVFGRLVEDYGVGYIKMDYNINAGPGTEINADSPGDGLLQHTRAYLAWLDSVFEKYPDLVIENCSSGGMRMEYSHLARHSIQSVTDQTDYVKMSAIAANCMTAVTPEQAAIWSYPLREGDREEVIFNMVNAILFRIHQSGHLAEITPERFDLVSEGIRYHKKICQALSRGLPFWPIGLASMSDTYLCAGIDCGKTLYMAVWRTTGGDDMVSLPVKQAVGKNAVVKCAYPTITEKEYDWDGEKGILTVSLGPKTARIFEVQIP